MISRLTTRINLPLYLSSSQSRGMANIPHKLQSPFYKPLPDPMGYQKKKYPRHARWDDPNYIYPLPTVRPTFNTGKKLIKEIQEEEKKKLLGKKQIIEHIRTGDVVKFKYYRSVSSKKEIDLKGLVIQTSRKKSLNASCTVLMNYYLCEGHMKLKLYSPLLSSIEIDKFGDGKLRKRLGYMINSGIKPSLTSQAVTKRFSYRARIRNRTSKILPKSKTPIKT